MQIVGVNHCPAILHMTKRMVRYYTTGKTINQFTIGYMVNLSLKFNNVFITEVENAWVFTFLLRQRKLLKIVCLIIIHVLWH